MEAAEPSRTAMATALARAHHQFVDRPPIFIDPLAARILGASDLDDLIGLSYDGADLGLPRSTAAHRPRRLFFAARSRFAEDCIAAAVTSGVRQVVILGAGLDTFAYRNENPGVWVFEVDHPATQAWKRERLAAAAIDQPANMTFVPVDFENHSLATELESAGFGRTEPAIFVWLGVVFYLTPEAAQGTLEFIAGQSDTVEVVLDYLQPACTEEDRALANARADRLAAAGEPVLSYFTPDDISARLGTLGFVVLEDQAATDVIDGYLEGEPSLDVKAPNPLRASRMLRARRRVRSPSPRPR